MYDNSCHAAILSFSNDFETDNFFFGNQESKTFDPISSFFQKVGYNLGIFLRREPSFYGLSDKNAFSRYVFLCSWYAKTSHSIVVSNTFDCFSSFGKMIHTVRTQTFSPRCSSIKRRIKSDTVRPSSFARFWSHFIWGSVNTTDCLMVMNTHKAPISNLVNGVV